MMLKSNWLMLVIATGLLSACASNVRAPVEARSGKAGRPVVKVEKRDAENAETAVPRAGYYIVKKGDTLYSIARASDQSVSDIALWNKLDHAVPLEVGQELRIAPPDGVVVSPIVAPPPAIVVKKNETAKIDLTKPEVVKTPSGNLKTTPIAGSQPYSEEAWKALKAAPADSKAKEAEKIAPIAAKDESAAQKTTPKTEPATPDPDEVADAKGIRWQWPASGKVVRQFNDTNSKGIDIAGKVGDAVMAAADGKVIHVGSVLRGYGNLVIIKHGSVYLSAYAHNKEILVKEGQAVKRGQKIAVLGNSDADKPKLHFEIRQQGKPVDPMKFLPNS